MAITAERLAKLLVKESRAVVAAGKAHEKVEKARKKALAAHAAHLKAEALRMQAETSASAETIHQARNLWYGLIGKDAYLEAGRRRSA